MSHLLPRFERFQFLLNSLPIAFIVSVYLFLTSYKIEKVGFIDEELLLYQDTYPRVIKDFRQTEKGLEIFYDNSFHNSGVSRASGLVVSETRPVLSIKIGERVYPLLSISHAAAYPILIAKAAGQIFGAADILFYRAFSIFLGAVTILLLYLIVLKLTGNRTAALMTAALTATSSLFVFLYRLSVVYENFPITMTAASALAFIHARERNSRGLLISGFILLSAAVAVKLTYASAVISAAAGLAVFKRDMLRDFLKRIDAMTIAVSGTAAIFLFSPYFILLASSWNEHLDIFAKEKGAFGSLAAIDTGYLIDGIFNFFRIYISGIGNCGENTRVLTLSADPDGSGPARIFTAFNNVIYASIFVYVCFEACFKKNLFAVIFLFLMLGQMVSWILFYGGREEAPQVFFPVLLAIFAALAFMILSLKRVFGAWGKEKRWILPLIIFAFAIASQSALHAALFDVFDRIKHPVFSRDFETELVEKLAKEKESEPILLLRNKRGVVEYLTGGEIRPFYARCGESGQVECFKKLLRFFGSGILVIPVNSEIWQGFGGMGWGREAEEALHNAAKILDKKLTIKNNVFCGSREAADICASILHFEDI